MIQNNNEISLFNLQYKISPKYIPEVCHRRTISHWTIHKETNIEDSQFFIKQSP